MQALGACVGTWRGERWQGGLVSDSYPGSQVEERGHYLELTGELGEVFTVRGGDTVRFLFGAVWAVTLVGAAVHSHGSRGGGAQPVLRPLSWPLRCRFPLLLQLTPKSCFLSKVFPGLCREQRSPFSRAPQQCRLTPSDPPRRRPCSPTQITLRLV